VCIFVFNPVIVLCLKSIVLCSCSCSFAGRPSGGFGERAPVRRVDGRQAAQRHDACLAQRIAYRAGSVGGERAAAAGTAGAGSTGIAAGGAGEPDKIYLPT